MKKNWNNGKAGADLTTFKKLSNLILAFALAFAACESNTSHEGHALEEKTVYTCPMHPEILRDAPGTCPICGMDLVKKENDLANPVTGLDSNGILLKPTNQYVLSSTTTIRPERKSLSDSLEVSGFLTYDARQLKAVSARYGGRIERLYVRFPFQSVKKGERLLDIYSPDLASAQQDLIFLKENDAQNTTLIANARRRLSLLGLTDRQILELESNRKPFLSLPVFSPYAGLLVESPGAAPAGIMPGTGMNGAKTGQSFSPPPSAATPTAELSLKEGMYVQPGQRLFSLQSLATVWAILEFSPSNVQSLKVGQAVELRIESFVEPVCGKINYIEPLYGSGSKNLRARVYLPNPGGRLKPGTLLTASVQALSRSALWIPATAALDLGKTTVVFVKTAGGFQSRKISTGYRSGPLLEVVSGLSPNEEIAENGQLLMDSEGFVKAN
ncbi:MAG: efflux RND transporter periplasmic adaptor subunit [Saprospiraceae bacterium]|nr:efflux RND transporter periplasmic adaptor subunit [Saprospiraceae bacterium]